MEKNLWYRIILVVAVLVVSALGLVPSVFYDYRANQTSLPQWWREGALSKVLPQNNLQLGLDLQGGMDLVVSVNVSEAVVNELLSYQDNMQEYFRKENISIARIELDNINRRLRVEFSNADAMRQGDAYIKRYFPDLVIAEGRDTLTPVFAMSEPAEHQILTRTVEQVQRVLGRRIDAFGLKEPEIVVQGKNEIRLQLPGVNDPARIKELIRRSAKLEFMLVEALGRSKEAVDLQKEGVPPNMALVSWTNPATEKKTECYLPQTAGVKEGPVPTLRRLVLGGEKTGDLTRDICYLLREDVMVMGKDLKDARPGYDSEQFQASVVNFEWNMNAAQKFAKITGEHVGEALAIVLEDQVMSAPVIKSKIFNRGQISGSFTAEEATDLSNVLRSGALDVNIKIEEERTVGASLGADSIHKGLVAMCWGSVVVVVFMIAYYSVGGIIADLALILNVLLVMAVLAMFGATLTLPGIAGIVLTVGMAVDANVLIFERMREELRTGKTPFASLDSGYSKAFSAIFDSNITTLIAGLVLLQWGTGPIKGFAITLSVGIVSTMFTAVVVTRVVYDVVFHLRKRPTLLVGIKLAPAVDQAKAKNG